MPPLPHRPEWLPSAACTQARLESPAFRRWAERLSQPFRYHRKLWEFCYVCQALDERGMLAPGKRGLGFAVGTEPMPALFAALGCEVVATDQPTTGASAAAWAKGGQHAAALERPAVCDPAVFRDRVTFRAVDMNALPDDLTGFDFCWSCCSFEHLGSIANGRAFIHNMTACLKPGGVAVHTTELNVSSDRRTVDHHGEVIFRRRDLTAMAADLEALGHAVAPFEFATGDGPHDRVVERYPYPLQVHLKLNLYGHVSTSFGLIAHVGERPAGFTRRPATPPARRWHPRRVARVLWLMVRRDYFPTPRLPAAG